MRPVRNSLSVAVAVAGLALGGQAFAATIAMDPDPAVVSVGSTTDVAVEFTGDGATTAFSGAIEYDTTVFDAVSDNSNCTVNDAFSGTVGRVGVVIFNLTPLATQTVCNITFTEITDDVATVAGNPYPLAWFNPVFGGSAGGDVASDGAINVQDVPPDANLVYTPASGGTVTFPGGTSGTSTSASIDVDATGTSGSGSVDSCVLGGANPGAFVIDSSFPIVVAVGASDTIDLTCNLGNSAATASLSCTETDASSTPQTFNLSCPAGTPVPAPEFDSTPAPNAVIECNGAPGSVVTDAISISNAGFPGVGSDLTYSCSTGSAGFAVTTNAAGSVAVGDSVAVGYSCTVPLDDSTATGTVTCTTNDADEATVAYTLSAGPQVDIVPIPAPAIIPANSLWSKLALFGLLAGLGGLVISMRRH